MGVFFDIKKDKFGNDEFTFHTARIVLTLFAAVLFLVVSCGGYYVVPPGHRGVLVTLGSVSNDAKVEGIGFKLPLFQDVRNVVVKQQTRSDKTESFSSDRQSLTVTLSILYRIPETSVVSLFKNFAGDPFDSLIVNRVHEALKEATIFYNAEDLLREREEVKKKTLDSSRKKVGDILIIEDIVIQDIALSDSLMKAIEDKMVMEQQAQQSKFIQQKTRIEAETAAIKALGAANAAIEEAKGAARAIDIKGEALRRNPNVVNLITVERWNGHTPLVVGTGGGNFLLPLEKAEK